MKRFYTLLLILIALLIGLYFVPSAYGSEITNDITINENGLYNSDCYINNAHYRTVTNGKCLDYNSVVSDNGLIVTTLTDDFKLIDSKEISGIGASSRSTGEHRDKRNYLLNQIHWLRLNIIELEKQLNQ
jgi:hypothetical protein